MTKKEQLAQAEHQREIEELKKKQKSGCSIPIGGCFTTIILLALMCIAIKECKRQDLRLKKDQKQYELYVDSLNKTRIDTISFLNQKGK